MILCDAAVTHSHGKLTEQQIVKSVKCPSIQFWSRYVKGKNTI
jgi:hypothetical protein